MSEAHDIPPDRDRYGRQQGLQCMREMRKIVSVRLLPLITLVLLNCLFTFFIHFKLELPAQFSV